MSNSRLGTDLQVFALLAVLAALASAWLAWKVRSRPRRIGIGLALVILGLVCATFSLIAGLFVAAIGVAVLILGIRTGRVKGDAGQK